MLIWEVDFYKRPLKDETGEIIWQLSVGAAGEDNEFKYQLSCPQSKVNSSWVVEALKKAQNGRLPDRIDVFRPQCLGIIKTAGEQLGIAVKANRNCRALKQWLLAENDQKNPNFDILNIEKTPPNPAPIQGEKWRFASVQASDLMALFTSKPVPVLNIPENYDPLTLGIASDTPIPGVVIDGGKKSMILAKWLAEEEPYSLNYVSGNPAGLIIDTGLAERWVLATFDNQEVAQAGEKYQQRKQKSQQLHFLLIRPDDSNITYTGFWLLKDD